MCEAGYGREILRFWEPREYFVVVGYSNKTALEVNLLSCRKRRIPIFRRRSGGGTILQGPGCLNYSLVLKIQDSSPMNNISGTTAHIMKCHRKAIQEIIGSKVEIQGVSDLTLGMLKFSGNAQYRKRRVLLFHGTFLLHFNIPLMEKILQLPSKRPLYRFDRCHEEFLVNLNLPSQKVKEGLRKAWHATKALQHIPRERIDGTVKMYSTEQWRVKT